MNKYKKNSKKLIAILAMFTLLIMQNSAFILGLGLFSSNKIETVNAVYNSTEVSLTNSNFENPTSTAYPITVSNWTKIDTDEEVVSGLINVSQSVYDSNYEDYELDFNPGKELSVSASENKVLMINAQNSNAKMGYQSASFVLSKNGYYTVEVLVYTQNSGGISSSASLYLTGDETIEQNANSKLLAINTAGVWKRYEFFVETGMSQDKTLNLELYLGSKNAFTSQGAVFFDNVKITSHSHDRYYSELNNLGITQTNYSILNLKEELVENAIVNADFEDATLGWTVVSEEGSLPNSEFAISGAFYIDDNFNSTLTGVEESPRGANLYGNSKALLINNINAASIGYKSSDILIEQHKLYRLSVYVKTGDLTSGATIKLIQQNPYGEENTTYTPVTSTIDSIVTYNATNAKYEDWIEYSFAVKGSVFTSSYANLELWLGDEEQTEAGYAFFDNVKLYELTTEQYKNVKNLSNVTEANFSTLTSKEIENANFNNVTIEEVTDVYPYSPESWTLSSDSANFEYAQVKNGIVNTNVAQWTANSANYSGFSNPGNLNNQINDEVSNNVLLMGNVSSTSQIYTSESTTLTADSYYEFSFYVQTQGLSANNVSVRLLGDETTLYTLNEIESELTFTKYSVFIKTGSVNVNTKIELRLGSTEEEVTGYAFFDNVNIVKTESADYNEALENQNTTRKAVDFTYENFYGINAKTSNGLYTPLNYTGANLSTSVGSEFIQAGVLNTENISAIDANFVGLTNPNSASAYDPNVLMIASHEDAYYTYTSKTTYSISAETYYKFSVYVKTFGLTQLPENQQLDEEDNVINYGASIKLTGFTDSFTAINTQENQITNEWQEYSFYVVSASDKTFNLVLSLGSENAYTKGYAFFSNISLEEIEEETYNEQIALLASDNPPTTILNLENAEVPSDDTTDEETDDTTSSFDFLLFPTLMFGVALIIAIIGYSIRQIKFNKIIRKRIKTEIYDRNRTLAMDHERREVVKERQAKLAKLKEQLSRLELELAENEKAYKLEKQTNRQEDFELTVEDKAKTKDFTEKQLKTYKQKRKEALKKQRQQEYLARRERLQKEFDRVEKEIEKLEREERIMFEKYRNYRAQVKAIKLEIKEKSKEARIKNKLKKQKEKEKRKEAKTK